MRCCVDVDDDVVVVVGRVPPRNNLTVFDMVTVRGHGAKELLRVGGKLPGPGSSLRFNVPQSTLMECRDGEGGALLCSCDAFMPSWNRLNVI